MSTAATSTFVCFNTISCLISNTNTNAPKQYVNYLPITLAMKKKKLSSTKQMKKTLLPLQLISNTTFLIQSAVGVFALGFIDAGYSGDWSRTGVISRQTEDLLKAAAFLVVPLCIFLIIFLFRKDNNEA